ncbi:MAG TPA: hypothetical protein ENN55_04895, partial [Firmicutes bacterium]|nr:hypothetical protein [Bacillota bacterium]
MIKSIMKIINPGQFFSSKTEAGLIFAALLLFTARFYRILDFPFEYNADELNNIYRSVLRYTGALPVFSRDTGVFSSGNLLFIPGTLFTAAIKSNIEYYRIIAVAFSGFFAFGLYLLARELKGRFFAALTLFIYCVSFWAFINSRFYASNMLVPIFIVFALYFFIKTLRSGKTLYSATFVVFFILGFFTYINWLVIAPVLAAALYIFPCRSRLPKLILLCAGTLFFSLLVYLPSGGFEWTFSQLREYNHGNILSNLTNMSLLFFKNTSLPDFFPLNIPYMNYVESLLFLSGIFLLIAGIRNPEEKLILVFAIFSVSVLFISSAVHQWRLVQFQPAAYLVMAYALMHFHYKKKFLFFFLCAALAACSAAFTVFTFSSWEKQFLRNKGGIVFSEALNSHNAVYMEHFDLENHLPVTLRLDSTYKKTASPVSAAGLKLNAYWSRNFEDLFGPAVIDSILLMEEKRYPFRLYILSVDHPEFSRLNSFSDFLEELSFAKERYDFQKVFDKSFEAYSINNENSFFNTFLADFQFNGLISRGRAAQAVSILSQNPYPIWMPADFYRKSAVACSL